MKLRGFAERVLLSDGLDRKLRSPQEFIRMLEDADPGARNRSLAKGGAR